ncbi:MAG TPA: family 43 glycosylhydrolase [Candidatus Eisenbergiella intestinigallinarum]|uniref:Family 43 glycosylhydrolase n=1 Tax=Candidatus Eisenbergiella intestinigallinarum TaxID=2838549 RepID=A0A9D2QJ00_9FIRM|nr:family 43 glycosylhydrolase [Candidatus Eisenbergiella intestinigallinarum]
MEKNTCLINGDIWYDTDGNVLHAHGGHMLYWEGQWYWYGENRTENRYVSVYRSEDLLNWTFCRHVLTTDSPTAEHRVRTDRKLKTTEGGKINVERPKVLYNEKTKQFVMWMHVENGKDYHDAACAIAVCDRPDGEFTYLGCFNPFGYMSRDCTLFQEKDGTAYFISASRDNADLHVYRLTEDYLNVDCLVHKLWQGEYREAPAVMERNGKYYMFSSYCTGWAPNQCRYAVSDSMEGRWSVLTDIGDEVTYRTQPAFILPVGEGDHRTWYYVSDRWNGKNYEDSRYVILPLSFTEDGLPMMEYTEEFCPKL